MDDEKYLRELREALAARGRSERYTSACLSYAEKLLREGLPVIFDPGHLARLLGTDFTGLSALLWSIDSYGYHTVEIPKKAGGTRTLSIPSVELKYIQRWILDNLLSKIRVSEHATGFLPGKSILTNASAHIGAECVVNLDIEDFFPSVSDEAVYRIFRYYGYTREVSTVLTRFCTYQKALPQGSPASPCITNIVCLKLDKRLAGLARAYGAVYTRYADDITFSGKRGLRSILPAAEKIIGEEGFRVNRGKTHASLRHQRQMVTGLLINDGAVKIPKEYKRRLRQEIYYCRKYGVSEHQLRAGEVRAFYREHLYGKAYFVQMIEPELGKRFLSDLDSVEWE